MDDLERRGLLGGRVSRRGMLRGTVLGGAGLATAALIGCGNDDEDGGDAGGDASAAAGGSTTADAAETSAEGVIQNPNLPYPHQFPDPAGDPVAGGRMTVASTAERCRESAV